MQAPVVLGPKVFFFLLPAFALVIEDTNICLVICNSVLNSNPVIGADDDNAVGLFSVSEVYGPLIPGSCCLRQYVVPSAAIAPVDDH